MASLAEELKLLEQPAPSKIDVDDLDHDLTSARIIDREELGYDEGRSSGLVRSSLGKKSAISLAEQDMKYAGKAISRRDLEKMRGNLSDDEEADSGSDDGFDSTNVRRRASPLDDVAYESSSDESGSEHDPGENVDWVNEENELEDIHDGDERDSDFKEEEGGLGDEDEGLGDRLGEEDDEDEEGEEDEGKDRDEEEEAGMKKFSTSDADEMQKGKGVVHQIGLWDSLLEHRIRLQKSLVQVNKLPQYDLLSEFQETGGCPLKEPLKSAQQLLTNLLHNMLVLQQTLFKQNTDTKGILDFNSSSKTKQFDSDEDIPSDFEDEDEERRNGERGSGDEGDEEEEEEIETEKRNEEESTDLKEERAVSEGHPVDTLILPKKRKQTSSVDDYSSNIAKRHAAFERFRDTTIKKWNERTRLASGKINSKSFSSFDRSTLSQIKQILSDKKRLIKRTQLKRSVYRVLGKPEDDENREVLEQRDAHLKDYDTEIFDDDDFYHQLLREFIERKSNVDPSDPIAMGRQWLEIQRLRNKVKKKVDTKASKGRRLRYDVHTKLVSFMAPQRKGTMSDSSRNELFSSLFGKRQPTETADIALFT